MKTNDTITMAERIATLAGVVAGQAQALADGTVIGRPKAAIKLMQNNIDTMLAWSEMLEAEESDR